MCAPLDTAKLAEDMGNAKAKANAIDAYRNTVTAAVRAHQLTPARAAILNKLAAAL
jgi:hypothetical protein